MQEEGRFYGGHWQRESTCLSSALRLPVMYGDSNTKLNLISTAAAAAVATPTGRPPVTIAEKNVC